jgi:hypothetical protein
VEQRVQPVGVDDEEPVILTAGGQENGGATALPKA